MPFLQQNADSTAWFLLYQLGVTNGCMRLMELTYII